jgi:hypothetical protein
MKLSEGSNKKGEKIEIWHHLICAFAYPGGFYIEDTKKMTFKLSDELMESLPFYPIKMNEKRGCEVCGESGGKLLQCWHGKGGDRCDDLAHAFCIGKV